jgi:hypothetical protein
LNILFLKFVGARGRRYLNTKGGVGREREKCELSSIVQQSFLNKHEEQQITGSIPRQDARFLGLYPLQRFSFIIGLIL